MTVPIHSTLLLSWSFYVPDSRPDSRMPSASYLCVLQPLKSQQQSSQFNIESFVTSFSLTEDFLNDINDPRAEAALSSTGSERYVVDLAAILRAG